MINGSGNGKNGRYKYGEKVKYTVRTISIEGRCFKTSFLSLCHYGTRPEIVWVGMLKLNEYDVRNSSEHGQQPNDEA